MRNNFNTLRAEILACTACISGPNPLPHKPRPVIQGSSSSRIRLIGQAPGTRVHASGILFDDPSGDRLRNWLDVSKDEFYNPDIFAITPMGFCFPGLNEKGGDLPPRKECAPLWQSKLTASLPNIQLTILIGSYAQKLYLGKTNCKTLTETVRNWQTYVPAIIPVPHPSWRNNSWLKKNPWFEDVLTYLKPAVRELIER